MCRKRGERKKERNREKLKKLKIEKRKREKELQANQKRGEILLCFFKFKKKLGTEFPFHPLNEIGF